MTRRVEASWRLLISGSGSARDPADFVRSMLGEHVEDFDVDAIVRDWQEQVNARIPDGLSWVGHQVHYDAAAAWDWDQIQAITDEVEVWAIAARHPVLLDVTGVSAVTGISPQQLRVRKHRGQLPAPDVVIAQSPGWYPSTIAAWQGTGR